MRRIASQDLGERGQSDWKESPSDSLKSATVPETFGKRAYSRRIVRGGIACTINAYLEECSFRARWFCGACSNGSSTPLVHATADDAIAMASIELRNHLLTSHEVDFMTLAECTSVQSK